MTAVLYVPVAGQRAAGRGGSPASHLPPEALATPTVVRAGRDVRVGDQVQRGPEVFLIVGFEPRRTNARGAIGRLAVNPWSEGWFVHDDARVTVLNPSCSALHDTRK